MADTAITGATGAYYAAGELSARGWQAALTWGNAPRTDIVAQHAEDPERMLGVQVKTRLSGDFNIGMKPEENPSRPDADEWFILVSLQDVGKRPVFYIAPWNHVAALAHIAYAAWVRGTGRSGKPRNPHTRRTLAEREFAGYSERWDLLDGRPEDVEYALLPDWVWDHTDIQLPEGLPALHR